ncbi:MAG: response regulator, partial [Microcystaceae cyanobacterium]
LDGLSAIRQLRQDPAFQTLPIIALTALAMAGDQEKCLQAGANDYLSKPVRLRELVECIQKWLKKIPKPLDFS